MKAISPTELRNGYNTYQEKHFADAVNFCNERLLHASVNGHDLQKSYLMIEMETENFFLVKGLYQNLVDHFAAEGWQTLIHYTEVEVFDSDAFREWIKEGNNQIHYNYSIRAVPSLVFTETPSVFQEIKEYLEIVVQQNLPIPGIHVSMFTLEGK